MSIGEALGPEHPARTRRRNLRYFFYVKHHKAGDDSPDAQWARHLTRDQEFDVFDEADFHNLSNKKDDLYGVRRGEGGGVDVIGTRGEQVAEFPEAPLDQAWHGYPCYPIVRRGDGDRQARPPRAALDRMVAEGVLTGKQRSRLASGKTI